MTNDAITEARRLLDTWYGVTNTHEEFLARAQTDLAALLSATGAAEARATALEQDAESLSETIEKLRAIPGKWKERPDPLAELAEIRGGGPCPDCAAAEARATAAEAQARIDAKLTNHINNQLLEASVQLATLQAQLTAARALLLQWDECSAGEVEHGNVQYASALDQCHADLAAALDAALPPTPEETA